MVPAGSRTMAAPYPERVRFLHTADWHIGKGLRGRSRLEEQEQVLQELLDIVAKEKVDALLMAGDVFDSQAPPPEAEKLVYWFISQLAARRVPAVILAGNHDPARRLQALAPLTAPMGIHLIPFVREGGVLQLGDASIALLPWMPEHKLVDAELMMGATADRAAAYAERMADIVEALCRAFSPATVNVVLGHLYVEGASATGSERAVHLARPYALTAQRFPAGAAYIALGHIHKPQEIAAPSPMHYSGSLLQLDFGEQGQDKRVVLVDARPGRKAQIESIRLSSGRRLRDVAGSMAELRQQAGKLNNGDLLRVTIQGEKFQPGLAGTVREMLPDAVDVRIEAKRSEAAPPQPLLAATPEDLFRRFCEQKLGEPSAALLDGFRRLYEEQTHAPR